MRFLFFAALLFPFFLSAQIFVDEVQKQPKEFTYVNDRVFLKIQDFIGYSFVPSKGKLTVANFEDPIKLGSVIFKIEYSSVVITEKPIFSTSGIKGENESKPFKMRIANTQQPFDNRAYFEMVLEDYLDPNIQGYLHFYVKNGYCYKILFRPESIATERTYFLNTPPYHIDSRDSKFFTHEFDVKIMDIDSMMGEIVYPFSEFVLVDDIRNFTRIYPDDRLSFKFELKTVKKGKKEKSVKYLVINDGRDKENETKNYLIKKAKDYKYRDYFNKKEKDCMLLTVFDESIKKELKIYLFRIGNTKTLNGIKIGNKEYEMRPGKKK
jgi:hypothetical protein